MVVKLPTNNLDALSDGGGDEDADSAYDDDVVDDGR